MKLDNTYKTELRIRKMMASNSSISVDEMTMVLWAIDKLKIFKKIGTSALHSRSRLVFLRNSEYRKRMEWINHFLQSKGFAEPIFTNVDDFDTACEDYDYYCVPKTELQYAVDEERRNQRKVNADSAKSTFQRDSIMFGAILRRYIGQYIRVA